MDDKSRELQAWLQPHLREHFGRRLASVSDEALQSLIAEGVARAQALGAASSSAVCRFVHLRVIFGADLERQPWASSVLSSAWPAGDARIDLLHALARQALASRRTGMPKPLAEATQATS